MTIQNSTTTGSERTVDALSDLDMALDLDDPAAPDGTVAAPEPDTVAVPGTAAPPTPPVPPPRAARGRSRVLRMVTAAGWGLFGFAVIVAIWAIGASRVPELPTPGDTFTEIREVLAEPFYDNGNGDMGVGNLIWNSLLRVFKGFGLAVLVGVPLGLLMGTIRHAWQAANPVVQILRPVSPLAWFPIWLWVFKDSNQAAVWVIFMTALWPTVLNTAAGAGSVPVDQRNVARVFRFGRLTYLRHVVVPHTLPAIVTGMRLSMGIGWMVIVAVEMLGGDSGIGRAVWDWYNGGNSAKLAAGIIFIGVLGFVIDLFFLRLAKAVAVEEVHS
jgi:nitrate/nitrite transport system permease protein